MCTRADESRWSGPVASETSERMRPRDSLKQGAKEDGSSSAESVEDAVCFSDPGASRQVAGLGKDRRAEIPSAVCEETGAVTGRLSDEAAPRPFTWRELTGASDPLQVSLRFGTTCLSAEGLRSLRTGAVVRLDPPLEEPVEIFAGRQLLGYGNVVLVDGKLAVQVTVRRQPSRRQSA